MSPERLRTTIAVACLLSFLPPAWAGDIPWNELRDPGSLTWSPEGSVIAYSFIQCDLLGTLACPRTRSVKYVALDGSREGTIVANARNPSWTR